MSKNHWTRGVAIASLLTLIVVGNAALFDDAPHSIFIGLVCLVGVVGVLGSIIMLPNILAWRIRRTPQSTYTLLLEGQDKARQEELSRKILGAQAESIITFAYECLRKSEPDRGPQGGTLCLSFELCWTSFSTERSPRGFRHIPQPLINLHLQYLLYLSLARCVGPVRAIALCKGEFLLSLPHRPTAHSILQATRWESDIVENSRLSPRLHRKKA